MDEQSIFLQALDKPVGEPRAAWLDEVCGRGSPLRKRIEALLRRHEQANSFLEQPPEEYDETLVPDASGDNLAASLNAGLAASFPAGVAVVMGSANHSVLKAMGQTIDVPRVVLREAATEGRDPIVRSKSPEMPDRNSDNRYQLQGEIARGGMGAILKGRDTDLGRDLAIKVLLDQHKDKPEVIQRFVEEAQIGGQLQHPGIAPVYELGQFSDKRPFFSMKLVKGETLSKLLADRLDPAADRGRFIGIFEQICQTMAYAHSRGVIHRDLKPANIMVGAFGEVQVMDWGLAKVLTVGGVADEKKAHDQQQGQSIIQTLRSKVGSDSPGVVGSVGSQTQMGSVMGTPAYMPPEQALGEIDNMDERADVFGLGAILCEILTGKPPYVADDGTQLFRMALRGKLSDCFQRVESCGADEDLIALTKHCLELEPCDRPRDAGVLTKRVTEYLESVETRLRAAEVERAAEAARAEEALHTVAETEARTRAETRARRLQLTMAAVVAVLTTIGGVAAVWTAAEQARLKDDALVAEHDAIAAREQEAGQRALAEAAKSRAEAETSRAETQRKRAETAQELAEDREKTLRSTLYAAEMNLAGQAADDPSGMRRVGQITTNWGPDRVAHDLRGWEWSYLEALQHSDQMTIEDRHANCIAWHPAGAQLATGGRDGHVRIWDAATGKLLVELAGHSNYIYGVAWSPNGTRIASASHDKTIRIWDSVTREICAPVQRIGAEVDSLCWSPDGNEIAAKTGSRVVISNVETGLSVKTIEVLARQSNVAWHPSKPQVALFPSVFDITTGVKLWSHSGHAMQWSPDGQRMAVANDKIAYIVSADDGKVLFELSGHGGSIHQIAWSPAGSEVATASHDDTLRVWDARSGKLLETLRGHSDWVLGVAWSPDGKQLASISNYMIKLWCWPHRSNPARVASEQQRLGEVVWSQDGSTLAIAYDRLEYWDFDSLVRKSGGVPGVEGVGGAFHPGIAWNSATNLVATRQAGKIVLLDGQSGALRLGIDQAADNVRSISLSPAGTCLAISTYAAPHADKPERGIVHVFDTKTGQELWQAKHHGNMGGSLAWSADGTRLAVGGWNDLVIMDAHDGHVLTRCSGNSQWIYGIAWSPDAARVALANFNHTVRVVDVRQGREMKVFVGHTNAVNGVSWSPDGSRIASCSDDKTVRVWNAESGLQMIVLQNHNAPVKAVHWSPDGMSLVSGSSDGEVLVWDASIGFARTESPLLLTSLNRRLQAAPDHLANRRLRMKINRSLGDHAAVQADQQYLSNLFRRRLDSDLASADIAANFAQMLIDSVPESALEWKRLKPTAMKSESGATLSPQDDGSILVSGINAPGDVYTVSVESNVEAVAAIRLQALPDPSLPNQGPGRHDSGNFQLSAFRPYFSATNRGSDATPLPLTSAWASFEYKADDADIAGLVDAKLNKVWHVWGRFGVPHQAIFAIKQPAVVGRGRPLLIELHHRKLGESVNLGRFCLSVCDDPAALDRERQRGIAKQLTNPWAKLAIAYEMTGAREELDLLLKRHSEAALGIGDLFASQQDWERVVATYNKVISDETTDALLLSKRADAYCALKQWELACADWKRAARSQPNLLEHGFDSFRVAERWKEAAELGVMLSKRNLDVDSRRWMAIGTAVFQGGGPSAFADYCGRMLQQFAESEQIEDSERTVKTCLLRPPMIDVRKLPAAPFTRSLDNGTAPDSFLPWGWSTRALFAYRSGDAESAVKFVAQSEEHKPFEVTQAMNLAVLAMAQHELDHPDEARRALGQASQFISRIKADPGSRIGPDLLIAEILYREAEAVINGMANQK